MSTGIFSWRPVTIANGQSLSNALFTQGLRVLAVRQGANNAGTSFTFQGACEGTQDGSAATFFDIQTDAAELSVVKSATVAQTHMLPEAKKIYGYSQIKVRSGTSGSPSAQAADVVVWVCVEDVEAANGG